MTYVLIWWLGLSATVETYATLDQCNKALHVIEQQHVGDPSFQGACHQKTTPEE